MIGEVKDKLTEYARIHFAGRSATEAMALKHKKERALLDQILPPKVVFRHCHAGKLTTASLPERSECVCVAMAVQWPGD